MKKNCDTFCIALTSKPSNLEGALSPAGFFVTPLAGVSCVWARPTQYLSLLDSPSFAQGGGVHFMQIAALKDWLLSRSRNGRDATTIVLHATAGGSGASSIAWLRQIGLSYHFVVERNGLIRKCVPVSRVAFHAGKSVGPEGANVNAYSIGIAFANRNDGEPYPVAQREACKELIDALASADPNIKYLTTHYHVSPGRKTDPRLLDYVSFANDVKLASSRTASLIAWKPPGAQWESR